jgi:hypothetical protein
VTSTKRHGPGPKSTQRLRTAGCSLGISIVTAWDAATGRAVGSRPRRFNFHTAMSPLVDRGLMILHVDGLATARSRRSIRRSREMGMDR